MFTVTVLSVNYEKCYNLTFIFVTYSAKLYSKNKLNLFFILIKSSMQDFIPIQSIFIQFQFTPFFVNSIPVQLTIKPGMALIRLSHGTCSKQNMKLC